MQKLAEPGCVHPTGERRRLERMPLTQEVRVRVFYDSGVEYRAIVENASKDGLLLSMDTIVPTGSTLQVMADFILSDGDPPIYLWCIGSVVHVKVLAGQCFGVGLSLIESRVL